MEQITLKNPDGSEKAQNKIDYNQKQNGNPKYQ